MAMYSLCKKLGINHPLDQSTCIGFAQRKPTCGRAVAIASRQRALRLLEDVYHSIQHCTAVNERQLKEAAELLHCTPYHRPSQAQDIADRWSEVVLGMIRKKREETAAVRTTRDTILSTSEHPRPKTVKIKIASCDDLDEEVEYRVDVTTKLSRLMKKYCRDHDLHIDDAIFYFKDEMVNGDDTPRSLRMRKGDVLEVSKYDPESESDSGDDTASDSDSDTDDHTDAENAPEPEPARSSYAECGICTEGYEDDQNTWECERCENRAHAHCFALWAEHRRGSVAGATCPFCRTSTRSNV